MRPCRRQHQSHRFGEVKLDPARSVTSCMLGNNLHGNREVPLTYCGCTGLRGVQVQCAW